MMRSTIATARALAAAALFAPAGGGAFPPRRAPPSPPTPAPARGAARLRCPNLRIAPPHDLYVRARRRRPREAAGDQRRPQSRPRARWSCGASATGAARCGSASGSTRPAADTSPCRPGPPSTSPTSARTSAAATGRSTSSPASSSGRSTAGGTSCAASASARSSTTACATCERTRPGRRSPSRRTTPAATRTPTQDRVTLGTSVGWSDIYPADYDKQWIDVTGLRGCFAFVMKVDPHNLLYESDERDNRSRRLVRLPYRGERGC